MDEMRDRNEPQEVVDWYVPRQGTEVVDYYVHHQPLPESVRPAPPKPPRKRTGLWIFLGIMGLLIVVLSTVTTTFLDAYSAGISSESVSAKLNGKWVAVAAAVLGTAGAILFPMENITDFLYLIGSVFAPMIAIQIADFFLLKKDHSGSAFDLCNLLIWVIGFVLYRYLMRLDIPVGNTLPDMAATIVICLIVHGVMPKKTQEAKAGKL